MWFSLCLSVILLRSVSCVFTIEIGLDWLSSTDHDCGSLVVISGRCFKMAFDDMREVHKRRYLLQPIAVEVFSSDGRNFLLAFPRKTRNKVYDRYGLM